MKAYVLKTGTAIEPFGDDVSQALILNRKLEDLQGEYLRMHNIEPVFIERPDEAKERPCLFLFDYLFFSERVLDLMLQILVRMGPKNAALSLPSGPATEVARPVAEIHQEEGQGQSVNLVYDMFYLKDLKLPDTRNPEELRRELIESCGRVFLPARERAIRSRYPSTARGEHSVQVPLTARTASHIQHWVHILWTNHLALSVNFVDFIRRHPWLFIGTVWHERLKGLLKNLFTLRIFLGHFFDYNIYKLLARMVFKGKDCLIHPTAYLENVSLGDRVVVGPKATVRNAVIGSGTQICENTCVSSSVIGDNCTVLRDSYFTGCVAYPGGVLGNYKNQICLFGRDVFVTSAAALFDAKLKGTVKVEHRGKMVDTGLSFIGSCIGHRAIIGFDVAVESGRAIPNDYKIIQPPGNVLSRVPKDLDKDGFLYVADGTLKEYPR